MTARLPRAALIDNFNETIINGNSKHEQQNR